MKRTRLLICALAVLSLVVVAVFLFFLPDQVPVHYNLAGDVDRIGSKYEYLIFPAFIIPFGLSFAAFARYFAKKGEPNNEKVVVITAVCTMGFFNLQSAYFLVKAFFYSGGASFPPGLYDLGSFTAIGVGLLMVVLGGIMPKASRNRIFGLRTKWSLANDRVWRESQKFGGRSGIVCGLVIILLGTFFKGAAVLIAITAPLLLWLVLCVAASYRICTRDMKARNKDG